MSRALPIRGLAQAYFHAKRVVLDAGYGAEVDWQEHACDAPLTERRFLSEAAWVILSSGMREAVVRKVYPRVARALARFESSAAVVRARAHGGRDEALRAFGHEGKIDAILHIASHIDAVGFGRVRELFRTDGLTYLQSFPFIGPVTAVHLAKNLGADVAKPDRHLVRIALACGYADPAGLCADLHAFIGEPVPVIDVVFWRFATLSRNYTSELIGRAGGPRSTRA